MAHTNSMVEELLRRIVKKYAALKRRCEQKKCLLALSVAWALAGEAAGGNEAVFEHIDESIHARQSMDGQYLLPSASLMGCYPIMVQGDPFVFDSEGTTMEMIMWDFYAVLIEHAWAPGTIGQFFYDVADEHQWKAYEVESQMLREKASSSDDARTSEASSVDVPSSELSSVDACSSEFLSDVSPFPESLAVTPVFSSEPPAAFDSSPRLGSETSPFGSEPSDPLASFDSSPRLVSEASPLGSEPSEPLAVPNISERITLESWSETQEYLMEMRVQLVNNIQNINQIIENINHYIKNNTIMMNDNAQVNNQVSSDALGGIHIHFGGSFTNYGTLTGNVVNHNYPSGQQNPSQNEQQSQNASQSHNEPQNPSLNNQQTDYAGSSVSVPSSVSDASSTPAPSSASGASSTPAPSSVFDASSINSVLMSAKGRRILDALRDIHILDEHYAPVNLSWAEMGYLAYQIAFTLAIDNLWQVMGGFWGKNSNSLRSGYNRARQMPSISAFDDRIKEIFR
ncbi:hypothetical protein KUA50_001915 [Segatella hominis]|uniref:hypothetical protein n=1 Tax=Segatella hominis TaxID=2518605 RepID=UPI001C489530|nr:hypothetical protein [Segatella hominis]WOZ81745.1 hypothetical protein KUA50_001915 [Segatella hominis]